ncbi:uncharacterized protein ecscr [Brachyhypopomus gauderio]|uniref:uncharacterized protein ecscr n=1 Tax=Brachyhypopomus gauderio TaxID=698409 RepID=UPI00404270A7
MDVLLCALFLCWVSLPLISAVKTTPPVLTHLQGTKGMFSNISVTETPASLTPTSAQHTGNISMSGGFNISTPASTTGETKFLNPVSTTYSSHMNENSNVEQSQISTSTSTPTSSTSTVANNSELSESPTTNQVSNRSSQEDVTQATSTNSQSNSLTMLAFGVMSFILILIIVMIILVTAVNLKGRCHSTKEEGVKDSVILESNIPSIVEKENIALVSVRSINTDTVTDSPQMSSVHSTILDSEDQDLSRDLLGVGAGQ